MADAPKYSDDEVRAILEQALKADAKAADVSGINHGELIAIGQQVGVSPEVMQRAAREVLEARQNDSAARSIKARRRSWLTGHAALFALFNALLFTVNYLTTPGEWWVLFSVFFWGLALALHAGLALGTPASPRALERERRKLDAPAKATQRLRVGDADRATETEAKIAAEAEPLERAAEREADGIRK